MSGVFNTTPEPNNIDAKSPSPHLLKRVLSHGSNATHTPLLSTPPSMNIPLSPGSGGARTPRARKAILKAEHGDVKPVEGKKAEQLVNDMDGLAVASPIFGVGLLPTKDIMSTSPAAKPEPINHPDRSYSTSTEGSTSFPHPSLPSNLNQSYGPEGFPVNQTDEMEITPPNFHDLQMSAQAAATVAAADEAIKQLNGTSTVFQGPPTPGLPIDNPYSLPRGYANFVHPQVKTEHRWSPEHAGVHRQSSTSSSTTEASTSSEESDLCIPSIEWVNVSTNVNPHSPGPGMPQRITAGRSPGKMPPPALKGYNSPRRAPSNLNPVHAPPFQHQQSLPVGASAHTPSGLHESSAFPLNIPADAPAEDDDDEQTVGHNRERSPSTSSQSAQSGLDLLWRVASANKPTVPVPVAEIAGHDGKGKRKAGAEAVVQWRNSGIPSGMEQPGRKDDRRASEPGQPTKDDEDMPPPPPKKRRRSEINLETIDPALRQAGPVDAEPMEVDELSDDGSYSDEGAEADDGDDSEYGNGKNGKVRTAATSKGSRKGGRARTSTSKANGTSSNKGGSGKKARKSDGSAGGGDGGGGSGGTPGGSRGHIQAPPGGVQCEYSNPLPVCSFSFISWSVFV